MASVRYLVPMRKPAFLLLAVAAIGPSSAQSGPRAVQPERPTVATHAGTVAPGYLEIETGGEFDRYTDGSRGTLVPTVFKVGLTPNAQLSVFASAVKASGAGSVGFGDVAVGVKWRFSDSMPVLGRFAVLPSIKLPTGATASGAGTGTTDVSLLLISSHDVGPVALDINAGYTRRSGDGTTTPRDATAWTISAGGPATGALGWVAELYGYPRTSAGQTSIIATLFGPTLSVHEWLALDAGVIIPVTGAQPHAVYIGGVWNVGRVFR